MTTSLTFEQLVARHEREVLGICRSILRDDHLSRDAAQETFLRLWKRLRERRDPTSVGGWLRKVALSNALDIARRGAARRDEPLAAAHETELEGTTPPVAERMQARELGLRYEAALAELSAGQRTVFLLRHEGGLGLAQVAETLGVSPATVKTQFARACLRLQAKLEPYRADTPHTEEPR